MVLKAVCKRRELRHASALFHCHTAYDIKATVYGSTVAHRNKGAILAPFKPLLWHILTWVGKLGSCIILHSNCGTLVVHRRWPCVLLIILYDNDTADLNTKFKKNAVLYFWGIHCTFSLLIFFFTSDIFLQYLFGHMWPRVVEIGLKILPNLVSFHLTLRFAA